MEGCILCRCVCAVTGNPLPAAPPPIGSLLRRGTKRLIVGIGAQPLCCPAVEVHWEKEEPATAWTAIESVGTSTKLTGDGCNGIPEATIIRIYWFGLELSWVFRPSKFRWERGNPAEVLQTLLWRLTSNWYCSSCVRRGWQTDVQLFGCGNSWHCCPATRQYLCDQRRTAKPR